MPKKQKHVMTFAEELAAMPSPVEAAPRGSYVQPPVAARGFTDADGCYWQLARGPLDPRRAKRLAVDADVMTMGTYYDDRAERWLPRVIAEAERPAAWAEARARFDADELPIHEAYEFTAEDGRVLLFIETYC
ncbi:hypothetical protein ADK60_38020 [Streptomyces sp. XY431]|uniref:hypothetical protein n=1 Tax=Streptomyces sp. XY431 TaxID=1415562 RepID=UPI0006AF7C47|nr:hypothetical protein [Streptomyces sp. XY431]KOV10405.1 hypothetical protein ADK60_38020 [Streptomyces sp. XY431]